MDTLVNFRAPKKLLEEFDGTCQLAGVSRTLVLRQLIAEHIRQTGEKLPKQMEKDRRIGAAIRNAVLNRSNVPPASHTQISQNAAQRRLKSFSKHILDEGR